MNEGRKLVRRSVLDRLVQTEAHEPRTWNDSVRLHRQAVLRDVEWLLNTRRVAEPAPASYTELQKSVYHYGLPDVTSISADSVVARRELLRQVEDTIARFEPRLSSVRVSEPKSEESSGRHVRFLVEATLHLETQTEQIVFDTLLEPSSGRFSIAGTA
jgi:type VI secretion system protein ImpF